MKSENIKAYWAYLVICIVWGTTYLAIRIGVEHLPPFLFAGFRWLVAGSILAIYLKISGKKFPSKKEIVPLAIIGLSLLGVANGLVVFGEQWVPSGLASLLITTVPFWVVGIESFVPKGPKLNLHIVVGLLLGGVGVLLIFGHDLDALFNFEYFWGVIALLGAVASWAAGSVYSKYKKVKVDLIVGASVQMLIAGSAQAIFGFIIGEGAQLEFTQSGLLAVGYLIVFGSIISYPAYIYALKHLPVSFVATYAYINPVIALFLGWLVLDEQLNWMIGLAAVVILIAVAIVTRGAKKQRIVTPRGIPEEN